LAEADKAEKFKEPIKFEDWNPTFLYYIRFIPKRHGVPLMYICRDKDEAEETMNEYFSDDYVAMATFSGNSYAIVTTHVHTFLVDFVIKVCSMLEKSPHTCGGRSLRNASLAPSMHMLNAPQMGAAQNRVRRMIEVTSGQEGT
jgi:hypothetical protein